MLVTFLISTFNRRPALLGTLAKLIAIGLPQEHFEIIVIDNASTDGTSQAVATEHPDVQLITLNRNRGAVAKNEGLKIARGEYVIFLDDDSYPQPGSVERMVHLFRENPELGAALFTVTLPNGSQECSAYPNVCIGCGTGFRRSALNQVGGLPEDFFMQAEEYDLSLRLLDAGWLVERFDDLHVTHLKTPAARFPSRVMRLDVRNNLTLIARYFPKEWVWPFALDWMNRYRLIAAANGRRMSFWRGVIEGAFRFTFAAKRRPIQASTFESFSRFESIATKMRELAASGHRRILFIDLGKNVLPYWLGAQQACLSVVAIADNRLAGFKYRDIKILNDASAHLMKWDIAIVSNLSPVHAAKRLREWRSLDPRPVVDFFEKFTAVDMQTPSISTDGEIVPSREIEDRQIPLPSALLPAFAG